MNIAILGYDIEGRVSYDYFLEQGHEVTICDQNPGVVVPAGAQSVLGEAYLDNLDRFDRLVRTAGLPPRIILEKNPTVAQKITTQVNEFLMNCPTKNVIGVTGTKGKGSTAEKRTPRPKPKIDFTVDALDFKNVNLLKTFVTDNGRILPRKYTGLPAHYQRRLNRSIKLARQMLLMK